MVSHKKKQEADNPDDSELFENTLAQAKSLQHCLEEAAEGIGLYVKANKQEGAFFILNDKPLKSVD